MLSKNKIKFIRSLANKKNRLKEGFFIVEGDKVVAELVKSNDVRHRIHEVYATRRWLDRWKNEVYGHKNIIEVGKEELKKVSQLATPNNVLGIVNMPEQVIDLQFLDKDLCICLDNIQDPGNLGSVLRIADWFGINNIFCSNDTVDLYNPKVVQSSMGSLFRVNVHYVDLEVFLQEYPLTLNVPVYGTMLDGDDVNSIGVKENGFIVMGNESKGIRDNVLPFISKKITIPAYPDTGKAIDSLNVSVATGIICSAFRRQQTIQNALKKG